MRVAPCSNGLWGHPPVYNKHRCRVRESVDEKDNAYIALSRIVKLFIPPSHARIESAELTGQIIYKSKFTFCVCVCVSGNLFYV